MSESQYDCNVVSQEDTGMELDRQQAGHILREKNIV